MRIAIVPTPVASAGAQAHGIGAEVANARRQVSDAWDDAAASQLHGFATYTALDHFVDTFTGAVDKLSRRVHDDGVKLRSTAHTATDADGRSRDEVNRCTQPVCPYQG